MKYLCTLLLIFLLLGNCTQTKKDDSGKESGMALLALTSANTNAKQNVNITFQLKLNETEMSCGTDSYILPAGQTVKLRDMRVYLSSISLLSSDDKEVPLQLDNTDFQYNGAEGQLALLDFADNTGSCTGSSFNTTAATNRTLSGKVAAGVYTGIKFTIGVPEKLNHLDKDKTTTPTLLQDGKNPGMQWNWTLGYKFLKLELQASDMALNMHLGSTSCSSDSSGTISCKNAYRSEFLIQAGKTINLSETKVSIQLEKLFTTDSLPQTSFSLTKALSCMPIGTPTGSSGTVAECSPLIKNFGLVPGNASGATANTLDTAGSVDSSTRVELFKIQ
ncbi:MAG: metallo-mystery pair system four-Cys motif protein [Leptospiraceae bacterium]|nr:metallo-mystery pair system four-Cys motif protein [Leptospiraceae bacterium]MCP5500038.1 metallo-mystery pair system four-Cys motif protein [Leptospiraceae bacterium]